MVCVVVGGWGGVVSFLCVMGASISGTSMISIFTFRSTLNYVLNFSLLAAPCAAINVLEKFSNIRYC